VTASHKRFFDRSRLNCYDSSMIARLSFRHLVLTFAILGLILAPLARPAMAMDVATPSMDQTMSDSTVSAATPDMPCCPDGMAAQADMSKPDPTKSGCGKDCPLMAACMAQSMVGFSEGPTIWFPLSIAQIVFPENDPDIGSLTRAPSPRPPNA
jgi:hypothetical protein